MTLPARKEALHLFLKAVARSIAACLLCLSATTYAATSTAGFARDPFVKGLKFDTWAHLLSNAAKYEIGRPKPSVGFATETFQALVDRAIRDNDVGEMQVVDTEFFELLANPRRDWISLEPASGQIPLFYDKHGLKDVFHDYYRRLEAVYFAPSSAPKVDPKAATSNMASVAMRLIHYHVTEDDISDRVRGIIDDDSLFAKYSWSTAESYTDRIMLRVRAYSTLGEYDRAEKTLDLVRPAKLDPDTCLFGVARVDLLLRREKLADAKRAVQELLSALKPQNDPRNCRFWGEYFDAVLLTLEGKYAEALERNRKTSTYRTGYDVDRAEMLTLKIQRLTGHPDKALAGLLKINGRAWKSVWTLAPLHIFAEQLITAIQAKNKTAFAEALKIVQPILDARKARRTHDSLLGAWVLLGRHTLFGEPLDRAGIDAKLAQADLVIGANHPDVQEFKAFLKKAAP